MFSDYSLSSSSFESSNMEDTALSSPILLMTIPNQRSVSPLTPSRDLKGVRLFRAISRKLARRSVEDFSNCEDDSRSSSADSCSSNSGRTSRSKKIQNSSCSTSPNHLSSSGSDSSDTQNNIRNRNHSTSSFRKVFQSLSITNRSQSCSSKDLKKKAKKSTPKRILRPPVTYTYVRGLSGLPTQRIPRNSSRIIGQNNCSCVSNNSYIPGLHR